MWCDGKEVKRSKRGEREKRKKKKKDEGSDNEEWKDGTEMYFQLAATQFLAVERNSRRFSSATMPNTLIWKPLDVSVGTTKTLSLSLRLLTVSDLLSLIILLTIE